MKYVLIPKIILGTFPCGCDCVLIATETGISRKLKTYCMNLIKATESPVLSLNKITKVVDI